MTPFYNGLLVNSSHVRLYTHGEEARTLCASSATRIKEHCGAAPRRAVSALSHEPQVVAAAYPIIYLRESRERTIVSLHGDSITQQPLETTVYISKRRDVVNAAGQEEREGGRGGSWEECGQKVGYKRRGEERRIADLIILDFDDQQVVVAEQ